MTNEMIERVAKALVECRIRVNMDMEGRQPDKEFIARCVDASYPNYIDRAKAVIQAMREPTQEMLDAGAYDLDMRLEMQWHRMIDAALKE